MDISTGYSYYNFSLKYKLYNIERKFEVYKNSLHVISIDDNIKLHISH